LKIITQVAKDASVLINQTEINEISFGYVLLVGFCESDDFLIIDKMIEKLLKLRVFPDEEGKLNLNIVDVEGSILSISQFTLYADLKNGNRPSYKKALEYNKASAFYDYFNQELAKEIKVEVGKFGSIMEVTLTNCGPVTIILDSNEL